MLFSINKVHFKVGFSSDDVCMHLAFYCDVNLIISLGFCFSTAFRRLQWLMSGIEWDL